MIWALRKNRSIDYHFRKVAEITSKNISTLHYYIQKGHTLEQALEHYSPKKSFLSYAFFKNEDGNPYEDKLKGYPVRKHREGYNKIIREGYNPFTKKWGNIFTVHYIKYPKEMRYTRSTGLKGDPDYWHDAEYETTNKIIDKTSTKVKDNTVSFENFIYESDKLSLEKQKEKATDLFCKGIVNRVVFSGNESCHARLTRLSEKCRHRESPHKQFALK